MRIIKGLLKKIIGFCIYPICYMCIKMNLGIPGKYRIYRFLACYSIDKYLKVKKYNESRIIRSLKTKKPKVGFVVYTSTMWNVDELYHLMNENDAFDDVEIILAHSIMKDQKASDTEYDKTLAYFKKLNYKIREAKDIKNIKKYDILFYLSPFGFVERKINLLNLPLKIAVMHTSYSYMLTGNDKKLDIWMYHLSLRYYTDSYYYKKMIENVKIYSGNARYLGFPKMDQYYKAHDNRFTDKKVIIYAPHHSVSYKEFKSATFEENYLLFLELAKRYENETFWIYKPHPVLRSNSVAAGIFKNVNEYDEYESKWSSLKNARVVGSGDYFELFKASDAMITDSVSFLAEYQFTNKPLLLLESGKEVYNEFGRSILSILYKCSGKDESSICNFIENVISGKDEMKSERSSFFRNNLEYSTGGESANKRIYNEIMQLVSDYKG